MTEIIRKTPNGAILYDNSIIDDVTDDLFVPESWQEVNLMPSEMGGRSNIHFKGPPEEFCFATFSSRRID